MTYPKVTWFVDSGTGIWAQVLSVRSPPSFHQPEPVTFSVLSYDQAYTREEVSFEIVSPLHLSGQTRQLEIVGG